MRLDLARSRPLTQSLQRFEYKNTENCSSPGGPDSRKTPRASIGEQHQSQTVPDPAIAHARGGEQPDANPARSAPTIQPAHLSVIAPIDISPEVACDCYRFPSPETAGNLR